MKIVFPSVRSVACIAWAAFAFAFAGCVTSDEDENRGTKVLVIGDGFTSSAMANLPRVAAECGVELDVASLSLNVATFKHHCDNLRKDGWRGHEPYKLFRNRFGSVTRKDMNIADALRLAKWNYVVVQQANGESGKEASYKPYGAELVARIRELAPQAELVVQEPWSYTPWDPRLKAWGLDQDELHRRIHAAVTAFAKAEKLKVIPMGRAVQQWRRRRPVKYGEHSFGGDVVGGRYSKERDMFLRRPDGRWEPKCDVSHLNEKGEFLQSLVWAVALLGVDPMDMEFKPDGVDAHDALLMKSIALTLDALDGFANSPLISTQK